MRRALELLALLGAGSERSGAELARSLGVTRAAVWNQVARLREVGVEIASAPGRGYCLPGGFEPLDAAAIEADVRARGAALRVEALDVTDSTNERLLARLPDGPVHACALLAEYQTAGRGRRGDRWIAPPGGGLCLSLGWRFDSPPATFSALSLVVGVALARTLVAMGVGGARLKWPNDVVVGDAKLAGILIEMRSEAGGPCTTVIGIGLNVRLPEAARAVIDQPACDVESAAGRSVSRNALAADLLAALSTDVSVFAETGFARFRDAWTALDALADAPVRLELPGRRVDGIARGVDEHGALLIEHGGAPERFLAGHLRRA